MFSNPIVRFGVGIPAAAVLSVALFMLMENLIRIKEICPPGAVMSPATGKCVKADQRSLRNIFAEKATVDEVRSSRKAPKKLNKANKPPPPPKMAATKQNIDLPKANIQGSAPTEIKFERVTGINIGAVSVSDRDAQPVRPPNTSALIRAMQRVGKSAECEVSLDVDPQGKPYNVEATCNVAQYERAATRAVAATEFAPKIVKGKAVGRRGVVYPFELRMEE
ncbi:hypothetical protein [Hirschia maritima]|uniref:hypothetical protein n=1 Tax=Hirschia maritima TaxID=1121961 RepID=UPI00037ABBD0|nr:hypothetical protein [Hirschia maritima]